jgi:hypothetical protein
MNLQENINRIQSMMGVITEDRKDVLIKNMIGNIGIKDTFNMVGGNHRTYAAFELNNFNPIKMKAYIIR